MGNSTSDHPLDSGQKRKKARARTPEKKDAQLEKILTIGQQLFLQQGAHQFSLRELAKRLDMNQNNLYNYVESKRELWIAIRNKYYTDYKEKVKIIANENRSSSNLNRIYKIFEFFLFYCIEDRQRFIIMHLSSPPPSDKEPGPYEKAYVPFNLLESTFKLMQKAIDAGEIIETNPYHISLMLYALVIGAAGVINISKDKSIAEPISEGKVLTIPEIKTEEYQQYVMKKIRFILDNIRKSQ